MLLKQVEPLPRGYATQEGEEGVGWACGVVRIHRRSPRSGEAWVPKLGRPQGAGGGKEKQKEWNCLPRGAPFSFFWKNTCHKDRERCRCRPRPAARRLSCTARPEDSPRQQGMNCEGTTGPNLATCPSPSFFEEET